MRPVWKWVGGLLLALLVMAACWRLGLWQWHRHEAKSAAVERIETHRDSDPVPYTELVRPDGSWTYEDEWTPTRLTGRYLVEDQVLVRNRPHFGGASKSAYGYEVLVPFEPEQGPTIVVNRGWVANANDAETLPEVPAAPAGTVELTAWLRPSEPSRDRDLPKGQIAMVSTAEMEDETGLELAEPLLLLQEDGAQERPTPLDPPDTDLGPHQAYAVQWWLAMLFPPGLWIFALRNARRRAAQADGRVAPKPKKVRIWDEEDG
ncbi:Cytochrome oxidase assembly protein ShyY1 [Kytococcus aerolatus]|uniref:SURF1-like protein n=1 Tax=Kytococcus aerolatus TaxID=592308 RepID=A0A212T0T8_9MICO|nr:SURF1 family protein [Kytococcus aerolatus]SNC59653.1 Cytochrome oxidase assembly protein ShyY1 [Kytococcus aerolatus]